MFHCKKELENKRNKSRQTPPSKIYWKNACIYQILNYCCPLRGKFVFVKNKDKVPKLEHLKNTKNDLRSLKEDILLECLGTSILGEIFN